MSTKSVLFGLFLAMPVLGGIGPGQAFSQTQCTSATARASMDAEVLCGCNSVTREMISYIQQHRDFEIVLTQTFQQCPALANLLGDVPTASVTQPDSDGDGSSGIDPGDGGDPDDTDDGSETDEGSKGNNGGGNGGEGGSPGQGGGANDDES